MSWKELSLTNKPIIGNMLALQDVATGKFIENFMVTGVRLRPAHFTGFDKSKMYVYHDSQNKLFPFGDVVLEIQVNGKQRICIGNTEADFRLETPVVLLHTGKYGLQNAKRIPRSKWVVQT